MKCLQVTESESELEESWKGIECQRRLWVCIVELFEGGLIAFLKPFQADDKKGCTGQLVRNIEN